VAQDRLRIWEKLFERALILIDSVSAAGVTLNDWSFGGGTVLMRRHRHRVSKDIDIFLPDPQYLGYATLVGFSLSCPSSWQSWRAWRRKVQD